MNDNREEFLARAIGIREFTEGQRTEAGWHEVSVGSHEPPPFDRHTNPQPQYGVRLVNETVVPAVRCPDGQVLVRHDERLEGAIRMHVFLSGRFTGESSLTDLVAELPSVHVGGGRWIPLEELEARVELWSTPMEP